MNFLLTLFVNFVLAYVISLFADKPSGPQRGNPQIPTVSQSRRVPLFVGKVKLEGPNILDATPYKTKKIKVDSGGLFGSKVTIGHRYYQTQEAAIGWGPAELYELWAGDKRAWSGTVTTASDITIQAANLFGDYDEPGNGGWAGTVSFIPGAITGTVSATMETLTGRDQPGYPGLARMVFHGGYVQSGLGVYVPTTRGFYFGNSENFRPIVPVCGYYPNPFAHGSNHKIGASANPAYVLYELNKNRLWGLDIRGTVNNAAIIAMAATLASEGLGISRAWYDATGPEIEREILELIDGIRYRDPASGEIMYKLIRDDFNPGTIPGLTDVEIGEMELEATALSATASSVSIEYIDIEAGFESKKLTTHNGATHQALGRKVHVSQQHWGAATATTANKIGHRESLKITRSRRQGTLTCDRTAWDWAPGDTFTIQHTPSRLVSLVARLVEIEKGSIEDGRVTITFVEDVFAYGASVFNAPTLVKTDYNQAPANVTVYHGLELPWFLIESETPAVFALFAEDPVGQSAGFYLQLNTGAWFTDSLMAFADPGTVKTATTASATSIVINGGPVDTVSSYSASDVLANGSNLLLIETATGPEWIAFTSATYNSGLAQTTLNGVQRGLLDTHPKPISANDRLWLWDEIQVAITRLGSSGSVSYRMLDQTADGLLATGSATTRNLTLRNRANLPAPPGNIKINGSFFPASITTSLAATWSHRSAIAQATSMINWLNTSSQTKPAGVTYTATLTNVGVSPPVVLNTTSGITGTTYNYASGLSPKLNTTVRLDIKAVESGADSWEIFSHTFGYNETI